MTCGSIFEEGPYIIEKNDVVPTCLSTFIECHNRFVVEAQYYFRRTLDVLIDSLIRTWSSHGVLLELYPDNVKVYHANGLNTDGFRLTGGRQCFASFSRRCLKARVRRFVL